MHSRPMPVPPPVTNATRRGAFCLTVKTSPISDLAAPHHDDRVEINHPSEPVTHGRHVVRTHHTHPCVPTCHVDRLDNPERKFLRRFSFDASRRAPYQVRLEPQHAR